MRSSWHGAWFPDLPQEKWLDWSKAIYREENGRVVPDSDPAYEAAIRSATQKLPPGSALKAWTEFERLAPMPDSACAASTPTCDVADRRSPDGHEARARDRDRQRLWAPTVSDEPEFVAAIDAFLAPIP